MTTEIEIREQLKQIRELKIKIQDRMWKGALPVKDFEGTELTAENIQSRIEQLADKMVTQYPDSFPILVALMDGAMPFATKLHDALAARSYNFQFTSMQVSSYHGTQSGELKIGAAPKVPMGDRLVIVVDDVCDTGKTYFGLKNLFLQQGAEDVVLISLVDKVQPRTKGCEPLFTGFSLSPDAFIIGCGLDYEGLLRNTPCIKAVDTTTLPTQEEKALLDQEKGLNQQLLTLLADSQAKSWPGNNPSGMFGSHIADAIPIPPPQTTAAVFIN